MQQRVLLAQGHLRAAAASGGGGGGVGSGRGAQSVAARAGTHRCLKKAGIYLSTVNTHTNTHAGRQAGRHAGTQARARAHTHTSFLTPASPPIHTIPNRKQCEYCKKGNEDEDER